MDVNFWLFDRDGLSFPSQTLHDKRKDLANAKAYIRQCDIHLPAAPLVAQPHLKQITRAFSDRLDLDLIADFQLVEPPVSLLYKFRAAVKQIGQQVAAVAHILRACSGKDVPPLRRPPVWPHRIQTLQGIVEHSTTVNRE